MVPLRHAESIAIYDRALELATRELGVSHAYTQLTRGNKAESLDLSGDRTGARAYLTSCLEELAVDEEASKATLLAAGMEDVPRPPPVAPPLGAELEQEQEAENGLKEVRTYDVRSYDFGHPLLCHLGIALF